MKWDSERAAPDLFVPTGGWRKDTPDAQFCNDTLCPPPNFFFFLSFPWEQGRLLETLVRTDAPLLSSTLPQTILFAYFQNQLQKL